MNRESVRSMVTGSVPIFGILALIITSAYPLAVVFAMEIFRPVDWLFNLQNVFFFLPQYLFPWSMTWTVHGAVPFGFALDVATWIAVGAGFSVATKGLRRRLSLLLALPTVAATLVLSRLRHQVVGPKISGRWAMTEVLAHRATWRTNRRSPNTRVQRTRSSPSALRSPLTRCPLGGPKVAARGHMPILVALGMLIAAVTVAQSRPYQLEITVADPNGAAIDGATVSVSIVDEQGTILERRVTKSRPDGRAFIPVTADHHFVVTAELQGFISASTEPIRPNDEAVYKLQLFLNPVRLSSGAQLSTDVPQPTILSGRGALSKSELLYWGLTRSTPQQTLPRRPALGGP